MPPSQLSLWRRCLSGFALVVALTGAAGAETAFLSPARGEALAPGSVIEARWVSPCPADHRDADEAELVLSLDGGRTFPIRISAELPVCSSRFRWTVPALPTPHARLGLRLGSDEREETELIRSVGEDFTILPEPDGRVEELYWRAAEAWTLPAVEVETADALLGLSMVPQPRVLAAPDSSPDADDSVPRGVCAPRCWQRLSASAAVAGRITSIPPEISRFSAPLPLRE